MSALRKQKTRPRGGASCPCPKCSGPSRVVDTRRVDDAVTRLRRCARRRCGHSFRTREERRD